MMQYKPLGNTELKVSELGFGGSPLGEEFGPVDSGEAVRAVHYAIDQGINFFDVAPYYGRTLAEERLGTALQGKRHQVVLATKCGRYDINHFDFSADRVRRSIDESLERLRTDYVDLLQAHDIEFGDARQIVEETIPAMREIQKQGKARFIGLSGLQLRMLRSVASQAKVDTILSYCRYNLMAEHLDEMLTPFAKENGIGLINASPLHMRILTAEGAPSWHPAPDAVKEAGRKVAEACKRRGVDVTKVALRYCLNHPYVSTTLVGMARRSEVEQNLQALSYTIDPELLEEIRMIVAPVAGNVWRTGRPENYDYANANAQG